MKAIALDTETYYDTKQGLNIPFVMTYCDEKGKSGIVDLRKKSDYEKAKKRNDKSTKVFHNAPYDITCLSNVGIKVNGHIEDTMIMANIINENFESKKLKKLAQIYLNESCSEDKELSKAKAKIKKELIKKGEWDKGDSLPYNMIPMSILAPYAKKDAEYTMALWKLFNKSIGKYQDVYQLELDIIPIIVEMQQNGMRIDRKLCKKIYNQYIKESVKCLESMNEIIKKAKIKFKVEKQYKRYPKKLEVWDKIIENENGALAIRYEKYNPDSDKQTIYVLNKLGIETGKVTSEKTQQMSIDKEALKPFLKNNFVQAYTRYQFLTKQTGTYYGPLYSWYTSDKNDRAHFSLYQSGAKSGRFSAQLVQTIPRREEDKEKDARLVRNIFIPADGRYLCCIDYDQIEMRLFAHFSNCSPLIAAIKRGEDPHDSTTLMLFDEAVKLVEKIRKEKDKKKLKKLKERFKSLRRKAKGINFGIIYGMGQQRLADSLDLPLLEAKDILDRYYLIYPVKEFIRETTSQLYKTGSVKVTLQSPICKLYREYRVPHDLAYKAVNIIIQGTAAYVMKLGMKRVYDYIKKNRLDIKMLMTVHDEIIFEINNKYKPKNVVPKLIEQMNDNITFKVPIIASAKISSKSWGDTKEWKEAV